MRTTAWRWLVLLLLPGCLLVQPLDDAKPDGEGNAGSGNQSSQAGGAGRNTAGSGSPAGGSGNDAGSGNKAGTGPAPTAGSSNNGGSPNTDFSQFTGTWLVLEGATIERICSDGEQYSDPVEWTADEFVEGGSQGDLLLNPGTPCELVFDVDADADVAIAFAQSGQSCTQVDSLGLSHELLFTYADFEVHPDGTLGVATAEIEETVTLPDDSLLFCSAAWTIHYER